MDSDDDELWADLGDASVLLEVAKAEAAYKNNPGMVQQQLQQKDLFGNVVQLKQNIAKSAPWQSKAVAGPSTIANKPGNDKVNAIARKQWDQTRYVKSGAISKKKAGKKPASKAKGKGKARAYDDFDEEEDDFSDAGSEGPLSDAEEAAAPPKPMKLQPDREACKTFTYPLNKPLRKYQYDIITKAFYTDTLVALPTGLGKTFLAATIMLNYYRWFPQGKVIFMAPSRPLVTQQIQACHGIAGIPLKDAVELTGKDAPEKRQDEWSKRRVFYCTPQTVKNDLFKGKLDPTQVVCIVVDEAHKATGDYAYTEVVRYMMRKNPHFRLLALTATPGSHAEVVQSVIDNLHIGHIEVRTDESIDIRQYIHKKKVDLVPIPVVGEINSIRERYRALMDILYEPLKKAQLIYTQKSDPTTIHPYAFQSASQQAQQKKVFWALGNFTFLGAMARCIAKLLEQSVSAFYESLKELKSSAKGKAIAVVNHPNFAAILRDTEDIVNGREFEGHPKMMKLRELIAEHFDKSAKEGTLDSTRIMVFCSFREVVDEIVERLNQKEGIRATRLVGQGVDTKGKKGLAQKQQNEVLSQFKKGVYNVLVATSIGEEGLDIGELDLIICYEASKSPIRTLQRAGRTGRARDGRIIVLMTEGIEEQNWSKANTDYKDVQNAIISGRQFELYADCRRLVPADIRPIPDKKVIEVEPFDPEKMGVGHRKSSKRKREEEDNLDLFEAGFQKANGKKVGAPTSKKKTAVKATAEDVEMTIELKLEDDGKLNAVERKELTKASRKPSIQAAQPKRTRKAVLPPATRSYTTSSRVIKADQISNTRFVSHAAHTSKILSILQAGREMSADSKIYQRWESSTYPAFQNSNVVWWPEGNAGMGRDRKFRPLHTEEEDRNSYKPNLPKATSRQSTNAIADDLGVISDDGDEVAAPPEAREDIPTEADISEDDLPEVSTRFADRMVTKKRKTVPEIAPKHTAEAVRPDVSCNSSSHRRKAKDRPTRSNTKSPMQKIRNTGPAPIVIDLLDDSEEEPAKSPVKKVAKPSKLREAEPPHSVTESGRQRTTSGPMTSTAAAGRLDASNGSTKSLHRPIPSPGGPPILKVPSEADELPQAPVPTDVKAVKSSLNATAEESPLVFKRRAAPPKRIFTDDTSSPDKEAAQVRQRVRPVPMDDSVVAVSGPPMKIRKLVRAGESKAVAQAGQGDLKEKPKIKKVEKLPGEQCPFFDVRAVNSDDPDSQTDPEDEGDPETAGDRRFLDSDDVANPRDMTAFYRESLMSQAAHRFHGSVKKPQAFKMRTDLPKYKPAHDQPDASQWSVGSFVVDDDDELLFEDDDDGLPDDDVATSEGR